MSERDWAAGPPEERQESVLEPPPPEVEEVPGAAPASESEPESEEGAAPMAAADGESVAATQAPADNGRAPADHAAGEFRVPDGYGVLEGAPQGARRSVGVVVSRFNGRITGKLLEGALAELEDAGVARDAITVVPVPGAFELPLAAMALAKTRRYACIVALGCVIRGDTAHFDFVAGEAASGLQLAALETGVPVSFGLLTLEDASQAEERLAKGAEAVRTGLEMADVFSQLRAAASA